MKIGISYLVLAFMLTFLVAGDTGPRERYMLPSGIEKEWPEKGDLGAKAAFWVDKKDMSALMVKAGYGDRESASKVLRFWDNVLNCEPKSQWMLVAALLGDDVALNNIVFELEHESATPELQSLLRRLRLIAEKTNKENILSIMEEGI